MLFSSFSFFSSIVISLTYLSLSLTHALPPVQLQITEVIFQPWSRSLVASHCVIDPLLHWRLTTHPTTTKKSCSRRSLKLTVDPHPPPHLSIYCLLLSIHPYMHACIYIYIYIHPPLHSPTSASHAPALTSLINQRLRLTKCCLSTGAFWSPTSANVFCISHLKPVEATAGPTFTCHSCGLRCCPGL